MVVSTRATGRAEFGDPILLAYDPMADRWTELGRGAGVVAADGWAVVFRHDRGPLRQPGLVAYDPASGRRRDLAAVDMGDARDTPVHLAARGGLVMVHRRRSDGAQVRASIDWMDVATGAWVRRSEAPFVANPFDVSVEGTVTDTQAELVDPMAGRRTAVPLPDRPTSSCMFRTGEGRRALATPRGIIVWNFGYCQEDVANRVVEIRLR